MKTIAKEFLAACTAGLVLAGENTDGEIEWIGTPEQWKHYQELLRK